MENSKNSQQFETQVLKLLNQIDNRFIGVDLRLNNIEKRLQSLDDKFELLRDKVDLSSRKHDWIFSPENTYVTEGRLHDFAEKNNLSYPKPE